MELLQVLLIKCKLKILITPDSNGYTVLFTDQILMTLFNETLGQVVVLTCMTEPFKRWAKLFKHPGQVLKSSEKIKTSAESLESSVVCLYYNTAHAVPISHST